MVRLQQEPRKKPTTWKESIDYSLRWLIAIDIGTTQLYIRYKRPGSNEECFIDGYPGYNRTDIDGAIVPTDLYYPLNKVQPIWGRAFKVQRKYQKTDYFDPRRLVRFWKHAIHQTEDDSGYYVGLKAQATYIFGVPDISRFAKDFFGLLFDFLFHRETGHFYKVETSFVIEFASVILSKPSGWPRSEYLIFQDAAEAWGLKGQISFVSETDALAKSWLRREADRWEGLEPGFSMIVVDWGGGTVDIDALEISSFERKDPQKDPSLKHGCETSTELFANHMRSRFSNAGYATGQIEEMVSTAALQFSEMKSGFGMGQSTSQWILEIPGVPGGVISLEEDELKQQFEPSIRATTDAIDDIIEKLSASKRKTPQVIIIGGGGSVFPIFYDSLVELYERRRFPSPISVTRVYDFKRGVAMGAIQLRQDITGFMKHSLSRESYAIPCRIEDVEGADRVRMLALYPGSKSIQNSKDWKFYFPTPVLQWFIKEGDEIGPNFVIRPDDDSEVYGLRQAKIATKSDLRFEELLVIYKGHPGADRWTPYDSQSLREGNYRTEKLIVDLRKYIEPKKLPRMNSKKGDLNRRVRRLDYDYSVEFEGETPIYFVQFKKPGEKAVTKLKVHASRIDLARLEAHQSLSRDNQSSVNFSDVLSDDDYNSSCMLEVNSSNFSSDNSLIQALPKLSTEQEKRAAELAVTLLPRTRSRSSTKRTSESLIDASDNEMSSSVLFQYNDSEFSAMAQDNLQIIVSRFTSTPNPKTSSLRSLQDDTHRLHETISDTLAVADTTGEFDLDPRHVSASAKNFVTSSLVRRQDGALSRVDFKARSRVPFQAKTQALSVSTTVAPSRRITRQAISEALATVSPNLRRRKVMFSAVADQKFPNYKAGDRLKDSLLPVSSKKQKCVATSGSKLQS